MMQQSFDVTTKDKDLDFALAESADGPAACPIDPAAEPEPEFFEETIGVGAKDASRGVRSWSGPHEPFWAGETPPAKDTSRGVRSWMWLVSICVLVLASMRVTPEKSSSELTHPEFDADWVTQQQDEQQHQQPQQLPAAPIVSSPFGAEVASLADDGQVHIEADADVAAVTSEDPHTAQAEAGESDLGKLVTIPLTRQVVPLVNNVYKSSYWGTITAGTPAESYRVVLDTGSGHLILPSRYCKSEACRIHKRYSPSQSATAEHLNFDGNVVAPTASFDQTIINFGTGEVKGIFVQEVVCVDSAGLQDWTKQEMVAITDKQVAEGVEMPLPVGCMRLNFIAATSMSEDPFKSFVFDGVLGLGLAGLSQTGGFNFVQVLSQNSPNWGVEREQMFAVFLAADGNAGSEVTFGGWHKDRMEGDVHWNDVLDPEVGHWIVKIKSLRVDGEEMDYCRDGTCKAVADSGTALMGVPSNSFKQIYRKLWHPSPLDGHCKGKGPKFHVELETFTVTMEPEDYAHASPFSKKMQESNAALPQPWGTRWSGGEEERFGPTRSDLQCRPLLMTTDHPEPIGPKLFILGEPVLRRYYTVYDTEKKRIGFGKASHVGELKDPQFEPEADDGSWFWEDCDDCLEGLD